MNVMLSLLAAVPLLEPDPGALKRIHPRDLGRWSADASPLWAFDDDAATGWKQADAAARLYWRGNAVTDSHGLKVWLRSGCQGSEASFAGWARPKRVTVQPVQASAATGSANRPKALELELADVAGWQSIDVPWRGSFSLNVKESFPGAEHAEPCISDLRVYTDGQVDDHEEQLAFEQVKRTVTERLTQAPSAPKRLPAKLVQVELKPRAPAPKTELALAAPDAYAEALKRARGMARELRGLRGVSLAVLPSRGWRRVALDFVMRNDATLEESLRGREPLVGGTDALLCADDFKLELATDPLIGFKQRTNALAKLARRPMECAAACAPLYASAVASALSVRDSCRTLCSYWSDFLPETRADLEGSGVFVKGPLEAPERMIIAASHEVGQGESFRRQDWQLLVFDQGRVVAEGTLTPGYSEEYTEIQTAALQWNDDRSRVSAVTLVRFEGKKVSEVQRLEAAQEHAALLE